MRNRDFQLKSVLDVAHFSSAQTQICILIMVPCWLNFLFYFVIAKWYRSRHWDFFLFEKRRYPRKKRCILSLYSFSLLFCVITAIITGAYKILVLTNFPPYRLTLTIAMIMGPIIHCHLTSNVFFIIASLWFVCSPSTIGEALSIGTIFMHNFRLWNRLVSDCKKIEKNGLWQRMKGYWFSKVNCCIDVFGNWYRLYMFSLTRAGMEGGIDLWLTHLFPNSYRWAKGNPRITWLLALLAIFLLRSGIKIFTRTYPLDLRPKQVIRFHEYVCNPLHTLAKICSLYKTLPSWKEKQAIDIMRISSTVQWTLSP